MQIFIYNSITRKKEKLSPQRANEFYIYTCGPTLYDEPHIGNWRSFLMADLLVSYLVFCGYKVFHVLNLTDVDDKTIEYSKQKGFALNEFTSQYKDLFFRDLDRLKIRRAQKYPRATEHIPKMIEMIENLLQKNYAYKDEEGSIYFRINSFKNYAQGFHLNLNKEKKIQSSPIRNDEYNKENYADFALWKAYQELDGDNFWQGKSIPKGRPGWHMECSAMSLVHLPYPFDIHTGGVDNIFPHHVNEIVQSQSYLETNENPSRYWFHVEHLNWNDGKMSKSKSHRLTLDFFLKKGFSIEAIRFFFMKHHYRKTVSLNDEFSSLYEAEKAVEKIRNFLQQFRIREEENIFDINQDDFYENLSNLRESFFKEIANDLNVPKALSFIFIWMKQVQIDFKELPIFYINEKNYKFLSQFIQSLDAILKCNFEKGLYENTKNKHHIEDQKREDQLEILHKQREIARKIKNYQKADELRKKIESLGYKVKDSKNGTFYQYKNHL